MDLKTVYYFIQEHMKNDFLYLDLENKFSQLNGFFNNVIFLEHRNIVIKESCGRQQVPDIIQVLGP